MKLFQSYVNAHQKTFLSANTIPLDAQNNVENSQREYELFKKIKSSHNAGNSDPWGMVSWKFEHKCLIKPEEFMEFARTRLASGYDCIFINPMIGNESLYFNVWEQGIDCGHAGLDKVAAFLESKLGARITALMGNSSFSFCNYFIATPAFWDAYFSFVDHALGLLESEISNKSEVGNIYGGSAHYGRDASLSMRPFVIERLFSSFIVNSEFKCIGYQYSLTQYQAKFGSQPGNFLFKLSALKNKGINSMDNTVLQKFHEIRCNILKGPFKTAVWQLDDPLAYFLTQEYKSLGYE